ncbi:MAG: YqgE/AlgH family protein [Chitinophaga sp.]|uniref:YqgE/AlgH family protein n=1 Tax=Chitinophaga sp. TaxID=1869181 RepID=UPI0025C5EF2E|nr:YqgE/AlgH family protein [Chitinophaga sp.]MBV8255820.1 YqgE/AlgH family protein [Chitinophaga sp.]
MTALAPGVLLIADPFLKDPNFSRTVVLLCEHQEKGSFGFVLNKLFDQRLGELIPEVIMANIPVYVGGPVQMDTIHFVHQQPEIISGGLEICPGVFWGGHFDSVVANINQGRIDLDKIKFFIGYSGWSTGQLDEEMKEKSWIVTAALPTLVFAKDEQQIWQNALKNMGSNFAMMANFPIDPSLN